MNKIFEIIKTFLAVEVLMVHPNHNIPFHSFTDTSDYQMGVIIIQQKRPVAYWSCKSAETQFNQDTIKKELLSAVMVPKYSIPCSLVLFFFIYIDHKNLTLAMRNCCCIFCWHSYMEEYGPTILCHHSHGSHTMMCHQFQWGRMLL